MVILLETLLGVINSRSVANDPNRVVPPASGLAPAVPDQTAIDETAPDPAYAPQEPNVAVAEQQTPRTEEELRQQLDQVDLYDLSGEKAAAEALRRDDEFKQQQIDAKAEQTKEFFAEQDRKQQESLEEMQTQAAQRLEETRQKEFWDEKQSQEMQAGMESELRSLHEGARQEHLQWRAEFTEGICRDDVSAVINNQIEDRVGAYKDRLDDIGTNAVDAAATAENYKVKLEDESKGQIDQQTAELHQEHFPEYQNIEPATPDGPRLGEIPMKGFGPFEAGPQGGYGLEGLVNKDANSGPWEQVSAPEPDKPFMRGEYDPRGDGTDAPPGWFKNVDAPPADGKDIPDGFMKPIDPSLGQQAATQAAGLAGATGYLVERNLTNPDAIHAAAEVVDHELKLGALSGLPHDVAGPLAHQVAFAIEAGPEGIKAGAQIEMEKLKAKFESLQNQAQETWETLKQHTQEAKESITNASKELAQAAKENLTISSKEKIEQMVQEDARKPETEQNKVLKEVFTQDNLTDAERSKFAGPTAKGDEPPSPKPSEPTIDDSKFALKGPDNSKFTTPDANAALLEKFKERQQDLGKPAGEVESLSSAFNAHAAKVDQQMLPPAAPQSADIQPAAPAAPAAPTAPDVPLPPPAPAHSEIKPPS